jgi:hypothetical protein
MKRLLLLGLALLAVYMGDRALRRNAEVLQMLWALIGMTAMAGTANTPKNRSVENRLNALVPVVFPNTGGTVTGNMVVTGTHSVGSNASVGGSVSVGTVGTFGGDVILSGEISNPSGTLTTNGNHSVTGQLLVNASGSATMEIGGNGHVTGGLTVGGGIVTSTGGSIPQPRPSNPGSPSSTYNSAWASSVTNIVQDIINQLVAAGVLS